MAERLHDGSQTWAASPTKNRRKGGWITLPFTLGMVATLGIAQAAAVSNMIVYLIEEFHVESIKAAQIYNILNGSFSVAPVLGAILADSYVGCFPLLVFSVFTSLLGMILLTLSAVAGSMKPPPCKHGSETCEKATGGQFAALFASLALLCIGAGGTRFNSVTMGAIQMDGARNEGVFFDCFFFVLYVAAIVGSTVLVYVEDNVSWGVGFGVGAASNAVALVVLLMGTRYYRRPRPEGSPFTELACVAVAAVRKTKIEVSSNPSDYHHGKAAGIPNDHHQSLPSRSLRFFNRAAITTVGDVSQDGGTVLRPWHICSVEQVEDFKSILNLLPLWSTGIILSTSIGIQLSLSTLQALSVDRSIGPHFSIPAGSLVVFSLFTVAIALPLLDRVVYPAFDALFSRLPSPLQRVGVGHILNSVSMVASALVERRRLAIVRRNGLTESPTAIVPMSVVWLLWPLVIAGAGEALHFPAQVALYCQEFPRKLSGMATGMIALLVSVGFFTSTAVIDLVRRSSDWLPDNINGGEMDKLYWVLAGIGAFNFVVFAWLATRYKYRSVAAT